jgi:hypothetical protein
MRVVLEATQRRQQLDGPCQSAAQSDHRAWHDEDEVEEQQWWCWQAELVGQLEGPGQRWAVEEQFCCWDYESEER